MPCTHQPRMRSQWVGRRQRSLAQKVVPVVEIEPAKHRCRLIASAYARLRARSSPRRLLPYPYIFCSTLCVMPARPTSVRLPVAVDAILARTAGASARPSARIACEPLRRPACRSAVPHSLASSRGRPAARPAADADSDSDTACDDAHATCHAGKPRTCSVGILTAMPPRRSARRHPLHLLPTCAEFAQARCSICFGSLLHKARTSAPSRPQGMMPRKRRGAALAQA